MPNPILASPAAYLRAISAPPSLGPYSAMTSTPYMMGGIGVGPGNQMVMKDQAGIDAAARAWAAAMAQQQAAGPNYAGMVFGDSPGQASQMAIGLRNQRAAEAAAAAARAQDAQKFLIQQEALRQANLLDAQIKMAQVQEYAAVRRDATEQRREASREQMLTRLLGGSGSGSGSGSGTPGIDVTSLLQDKEKLRATGAGLEAQQQALYNQQFLAAKQAAEQFPGYVVTKGTARNPAPSIEYVGDPKAQSDEALRVIQTAMLGQTAPKPVEAWTEWDWSRFYGNGETPTIGPGFLEQLQNLQAKQAAAKANLASLSDVFAARKDLAGPKQGPNPQVLQALLQYLNPAPAQVPSRIVPPPYALLDNRTAPVVQNNPRPAPTPEQIAWYAQHAPFSPNAPGQGPLTGLMPTPVPGPVLPGGINPLADAALGLFPGGTAPTPMSGPAAVPTLQYSNGRLVPIQDGPAQGTFDWAMPTAGWDTKSLKTLFQVQDAYRSKLAEIEQAPPMNRDYSEVFGTLDQAIARKLGVQKQQIGSSRFYRKPEDVVASNRDAFLNQIRQTFGNAELLKILRSGAPKK